MPGNNDGFAPSLLDELANMLCGLCSRVEEIAFRHDLIAADPTLLNWWITHKESDGKRRAIEAAQSERARLRSSALAKLTRDEIEALGLR
jgi:hypothetical protein